jgi:hypothetical protein
MYFFSIANFVSVLQVPEYIWTQREPLFRKLSRQNIRLRIRLRIGQKISGSESESKQMNSDPQHCTYNTTGMQIPLSKISLDNRGGMKEWCWQLYLYKCVRGSDSYEHFYFQPQSCHVMLLRQVLWIRIIFMRFRRRVKILMLFRLLPYYLAHQLFKTNKT